MSTNDRPLMNITRLGSTACTLAQSVATELTNGVGQNFAQAPQWATKLRGIWVNNQKGSCASDDMPLSARGWLDSEDAVHLKPFAFLFPEVGTAGGTSGFCSQNATKGEFYPINADVKPGSRIKAYYVHDVTQDSAVAPYAWIDFVWSNDVAVNPPRLDCMQDTQRYRVVNDRTTDAGWQATVATAARARADRAYSFSEGSFITELCGNAHLTVHAAASPSIGQFTFESNEVPLMPSVLHVNPSGTSLGAAEMNLMPMCVTRRPIMAQVVRKNCHIESYFTETPAGTLGANGCWITGLEFIR